MTNHTNSRSIVSPYGERILASGVFKEQLNELARVVSPFCCLPEFSNPEWAGLVRCTMCILAACMNALVFRNNMSYELKSNYQQQQTKLMVEKIAPKVQMPRYTIHHSTNTATADACIQDFFTAITNAVL